MISSRAVIATALALVSSPLALGFNAPGHAASSGLVINEVYGAGGNSGAAFNADFVELLNPTAAPIDLAGLAVHYRSASGGSGGTPYALSGTVPAGSTWLVQMSNAGANGAALPAPDAAASPAFSMAAAGGQVALQQGTTIIATSGNTAGVAGLVDFVGVTGAASFEGATAPAATAALSINRTNGVDTDANNADFTTAAPTPESADAGEPTPVELAATDPGDKSFTEGEAIAPITLQATGGTAPYSFTSTELPAGLTLSGDQITGTPTAAGATTVTLTATDSAVTPASATAEFQITVMAPSAAITIADIQGSTNTSPVANTVVTTQGVVTSLYASGGFNGFHVQTPGDDTTPGKSDGLFVFTGANTGTLTAGLAIGDSVQVRGTAKEFNGLTELDAVAGTVTEIDSLGAAVANTAIPGTDCALPGTDCLAGAALDAAKEEFEGEIFQPTSDYTVTDVYDGSASNPPNSGSSNFFGEIGLAANSDLPLVTPTEVIDAQDTAAIAARVAWNNAHRVVLDDGSSTAYWNTTNTAAGKDSPLPWYTQDHQVRVGAGVSFDQPVVLDYRFGWKVQPTSQVVGAPTGKVTFEQNRPTAPAEVGGDLKLATFNVLNFFTTLGVDFGGCTSFVDRAGNPIAVNTCPGAGPRGAWDAANFERQKSKIVNAINALGADIVSIEEVENSLVVDGHDRDEALAALVDALNAATGAGTWDYVRSPAEASESANVLEQDVIRTGFIFKPAAVETVGAADMLFGSTAFANAREPFAQTFKPVGGGAASTFAVIVNHFKSKGSGTNDGTGQGNANPDRIAQANALATFADEFASAHDTSAVFLTGDFNAYSEEDPIQALDAAGYTGLETPGKFSYSFDGMSGSLDHVLVNAAAQELVTGSDIWEINGNETVFNQYSRYNYVGTDLYNSAPFSASDHNPEVIGITPPTLPAQADIQVLATNDFHGRIKANGAEAGAAVLAGAVKQLRAANPNTVFAAAGDLIGASTFESFIAHDKPTIDALNSAGLDVSAVGNHEFDAGYDDLLNRVMAPYDAETNPYGGAEWEYIGANVHKHDAAPDDVLDPTYVREFDGVQVGFIGAVTEHLDELVSPGGIEGVEVEDVVTATNREADLLEAAGIDVIVLLVHEGAPTTNCATMDDDPASDFGSIITGVNDNVDAIVSGHTHLAYDCSFPVAGWAGRTVTDRPVVSAGQYGTNLNQLTFTVDTATGDVVAKTQGVLALSGKYAADAATQAIVDQAVAEADVLGAAELGEIAGPFNRAKLSTGVENRGGESTLGNLVAEAQRWATSGAESGEAQIAFMNPGGLRADMVGTPDTTGGASGYPAVLTYKQAATVQPFANTLVNMDLTGAQVKAALEQQWQPAGSSRPFLRLGTSAGFRYTYDAARPAGDRVTGIWLGEDKLDPAASYSVTVNSFLASGGDNFGAFAGGAGRADTGKIDLTAMVDYLAAFAGDAPLPVDATQRSVGVTFPAGAPAAYVPGSEVAFGLSSLAMSTPPDAKDAAVRVALGDTELGTFPVDNTVGTDPRDEYGTAAVRVTLPSDLAPGAAALTVTGLTTGTVATVPVVVEKAPSTVTATVDPGILKVRKDRAQVTVDVSSIGAPTGRVEIHADGRLLDAASLVDGVATLTVGPFARPGTVTLEVRYLGDDRVAPSSTTTTVEVTKSGR
ncbi:ExeM/NucH family extracellular endonuclease [Nocardioides cavernaquae]|uniref:ExeM/NucH family extracellular endonuclease n=1 Tax=Nocardioides cavernaquae TaxID=2321396 RepID=UPI001603C92E|nr:ExeM/NucH family extracellular endonuclease [Nocardioides cavernaquae]